MVKKMRNKIILIEDDKNLCDSITLILERAGYVVAAKDSIRNAYELLLSGEYHLVISDNNLPKLKELLSPTIGNNTSQVPILIFTDHYYPVSAELDKQNAITYLDKPSTPENLLSCIGKILGNGYHKFEVARE